VTSLPEWEETNDKSKQYVSKLHWREPAERQAAQLTASKRQLGALHPPSNKSHSHKKFSRIGQDVRISDRAVIRWCNNTMTSSST
jgi:hypothetical protein